MISYEGDYDVEGHKYAHGGKGWNYYKPEEVCEDYEMVECYDEDCGEYGDYEGT